MTAKTTIRDILSKIQTELKAPKSQYNKFGQYHYRKCEDILEGLKPFLLEANATMVLSDTIEAIGDRIYVKSLATLSVGCDSVSATAYAREPLSRKGMDEAQLTGATSSYSRKYALNGLFCIDDAVDADGVDNTETVHRFKKGEADEIIAQSLACLEMDDGPGLKEVLEGYADDPDVKIKVWQLFNSTQRSSMKKLLNGD